MRTSASGETTDAKYKLYNKTTGGKTNDMWRFQRYNIETLEDKAKLTSNKDRNDEQDQRFICAF